MSCDSEEAAISISCHCGEAATSNCAGCNQAQYCSRPCQVAAWPRHKTRCHAIRQERDAATRLETFRCAWIDEAGSRIGGNIDAFAFANPGHDVHVRIDETIDEFTRGSSFHFAHLSVGDLAEHPAVRYTLMDYVRTKKMDPGMSKIAPPSGTWSITFDM